MKPLLLLFLSLCLTIPLSILGKDLNSHGNDIDYNTLIDDKTMDWLLTTYKMLHAAPELSHHEEKTSEFFASELRKLGFAVTEHIGKYEHPEWTGYGVVGVMKNGTGPTVLLRTELDALPVDEKTDVPYASKVKTKNDLGVEVSVMHACGHDIHITSMLGTAKTLAGLKNSWHGTLVILGQPAEETIDGARAVLRDGLYTKVPQPDFVIALHDSAELETGRVGYAPGYAMASSTAVDIKIRGLGGHGAQPQSTKDPIVVAAQVVMALQTIVSRENSPLDPSVLLLVRFTEGHATTSFQMKLTCNCRFARTRKKCASISSLQSNALRRELRLLPAFPRIAHPSSR